MAKERKPLTAKKDKSLATEQQTSTNLDATDQEQILSKLRQKDGKRNVQRITVDLPQGIYDRMKEEVQYNGLTIRGFIINLVRDHFKNKET